MATTITRTGGDTVIARTGLTDVTITSTTDVEITYNSEELWINILVLGADDAPIALEVADITTVNGVNVTAYTIEQLVQYIADNCFGIQDTITGATPFFTVNGTTSAALRGYRIQNNGVTISEYESFASTGETRVTSGFVGFGGFLTLYTDGVERVRIKSTGVINLPNLPTSSAGLVTGDIWNDGGTIKVV
jgi:hypothetical protein